MSNIIDSIQLSGTVYTLSAQTSGGNNVVELTQAQYDALVDKDPDVFYIITDAQAGDLTNYYTKAETSGATELATAFAATQPKLSAGTNITIDANNVISAEGGGGVNVVQTTGTSTADVMSQDAVTTKLKTKLDLVRVDPKTPTSNYTQLNLYLEKNGGGSQSLFTYVKAINGKSITSQNNNNLEGFSLIETSAITTSISSSSTDAQVPSAKAVNDKLGGLSIVKLTQAEYDALATKDSSTLYVIIN